MCIDIFTCYDEMYLIRITFKFYEHDRGIVVFVEMYEAVKDVEEAVG